MESGEPGLFRLWALVGNELHQLRLTVPRVFYVNQRVNRDQESSTLWKKCNRILPRGRPLLNLYHYSISEELYRQHEE